MSCLWCAQIVLERPTPVLATNVPDVFFPETSKPLFEGIEDDYIAEYVANVCHARDVHVKLVVCSSDAVQIHVDNRRVRPTFSLRLTASGEAPTPRGNTVAAHCVI